jgi:hypothetical protein
MKTPRGTCNPVGGGGFLAAVLATALGGLLCEALKWLILRLLLYHGPVRNASFFFGSKQKRPHGAPKPMRAPLSLNTFIIPRLRPGRKAFPNEKPPDGIAGSRGGFLLASRFWRTGKEGPAGGAITNHFASPAMIPHPRPGRKGGQSNSRQAHMTRPTSWISSARLIRGG